jgi:signal transduction histidine kinase
VTQPARLAVVGLGLLFGAGAEWLRIQSGWPLSWVVGDATPGALFFVAGLLAWGRRSGSPIGPLMIAAGFAWFVGTYGASRNPVIDRLGVGFQGWYDFLIAALILVYPTGRLVGMAPRVVLVAFGILIAIRSAFRFAYSRASTDYDLRDPAAVDQFVSDRTIRDTTEVLFRYGLTVVALLILAVVIRRLVRDTAAARRVAGPILVAGIGFAVAILVEVGAIALADSSDERLAVWDTAQLLTVVSAGAIPIALLFGLTRDRLARGSVADLVVQLGDGPERPGLRDVLARALQDPSLEIAYPAPGPETDRYVDAEGQPMAVPDAARTDRATTRLEASGRTIAVLIHDPAVGEQRELVGSVAAATRLALENERLTAEVRTQLDEVRASRARIVAAGDAERRRVERDLHDGAQQRLVTLALSLQMARESVNGADPALAATLGRATAELEQALAELRELARGLHPTILTEDGLGAAVQALADRSSVPVRVAVRTGRHTPGVEAAAYFVVAESLTNVAKYAAATGAEVRVNEVAGLLIVEVADDGVGGADPGSGSGLRGLEDRVSAAGGTLTVRSDPGRGTTVRAEIPCG